MNTHQSGADTLSRPEDEKLSVAANLAYGFQHVLTMYGGIVAVPLIIGQAAGLSPTEIGLLITASLLPAASRRSCKPSASPFSAVSFLWFRAFLFGRRHHGGHCHVEPDR